MPRDRADIVSSLTSKGFELRQGNRDHDFLFLVHSGQTQAVFTKVSRGTSYRTIGDKLLGKMSRQLKITRTDFNALVDCPMTQQEYVLKLRQLGIIK